MIIDIGVYDVVIIVGLLTIVSYLFTLISRKTRIPTVLMLLILGVALRLAADNIGWDIDIPFDVIRFFGVLGLILILLEAGLDLKLTKDRLQLMKKASLSALFGLLLSTAGIAAAFYYILDQSIYVSLIYAIPLSVISSTVVASSIDYLSAKKREFLTYESALSDIIGILLFDMLLVGQSVSVGLVAANLLSVAIAMVLSVAGSAFLIWVLTRVDVNIKAFLIFAILLLLYAIGHKLQLPTLLAVLVFGLIINNWRTVRRYLRSKQLKKAPQVKEVSPVADTVKSVTQESAFIVRTFFFIMFGYNVSIAGHVSYEVVIVGLIITFVILIVRFVYLKIFVREHVLPELFFAPRGLVTVVLFYSIPASIAFDKVGTSVVFFVIMSTLLIMFLGSLWFTPKHETRQAEESKKIFG